MTRGEAEQAKEIPAGRRGPRCAIEITGGDLEIEWRGVTGAVNLLPLKQGG
jgi:hypothetical protein